MKTRFFVAIVLAGISLLLLTAQSHAQTKASNIIDAGNTEKAKSEKSGELRIKLDYALKNNKFNSTINLYLLDEDLDMILQNSGMLPVISLGRAIKAARENIKAIELYAMLHSLSRMNQYKDVPFEFMQAEKSIKQHTIATATERKGESIFNSIKKGKYYLMAVGGARHQVLVWNLPVEIKAGKQKITLDDKNVAAKF